MSIFKTKLCWSNESVRESKESDGLQNNNCLKIDKFNSHNDSDCIIICEGTHLTIYKPNNSELKNADVILEKELDNFVIYIDTGKFLMNSEDRQIIVLHSQSYAIYALERKDGHNEAGHRWALDEVCKRPCAVASLGRASNEETQAHDDLLLFANCEQNILQLLISHKFTRPGSSLTTGHFDNIKSRQLVCIQALDGSLSFFDQDIFLFLCVFNDIVMPGPVTYVSSCDCFVICKSTWIIEIYSFQQLRDFSELSTRQNKKQIPQWSYNAGEEISAVQAIQTSNNFSSIIAMGERYLYCFQDNGLMKFMKKFDYMPICFHAYLIGWFYEPGARLLVMVASEDSNLFIYEDTTLLWSCDLLCKPIAISRCFLKSIPGGVVTLSNDGIVNVTYLGTDPDLSYGKGTINEPTSHEAVQTELEEVEKTLQNVIVNKGDPKDNLKAEDLVKIHIDIGKPVQDLFHQPDYFDDAALHLLMAPVILRLTFEDPKLIQALQISYICVQPLASSESIICFDSVNGVEIIETNIFISCELNIVKCDMEILFTITDDNGKILVLSKTAAVPLSLFCTLRNEVDVEYGAEIVINIKGNCIDLLELLSDFDRDELFEHDGKSIISIYNRASKNTVTIAATDKQYVIKGKDYTDIVLILEKIIYNLDNYYKIKGETFKYNFKVDKELNNKLIHKFIKCIEGHAKARIKLKEFENQLNILQRQFTLIQKKLLVQYGSQPPGDCEDLDFLMKDTYDRLQNTARQIIEDRVLVSRAGNGLVAVGNLIIHILKVSIKDNFKVKLIEEMLALNTLYEDFQEWEESVNQAMPYIVNNLLTKTEKDKEKMASLSEQGILSHINLKKFLKQIRLLLDRMFAEAIDTEGENDMDASQSTKVVRIQELVEVI